MASTAPQSPEGLGDDFQPLPGSDIRYEPEDLLQKIFKPTTQPEELRPRGRKKRRIAKPNPEYDEPVYQLQKKLLQLRMMRAVNHPDFRSSDIRKARKMIARLKTAQRFEELRAEGIDPYKQYKRPKKERRRRRLEQQQKEEAERKRIQGSLERARQRRLKEERREQRRAERLAVAAAARGETEEVAEGSAPPETNSDAAAL